MFAFGRSRAGVITCSSPTRVRFGTRCWISLFIGVSRRELSKTARDLTRAGSAFSRGPSLVRHPLVVLYWRAHSPGILHLTRMAVMLGRGGSNRPCHRFRPWIAHGAGTVADL